LWNPWIVWLHVLSDGLISLSYFCIPIALIYFVRRRSDLPFHWIFWMFGLFILGCGATHLMEVWTIWRPAYVLSGVIKAVTAGISIMTALLLVPLVPKALALPSQAQLASLNEQLKAEIVEREQMKDALEQSLKQAERAMEDAAGQRLLIAERRYVEEVLKESQDRLQGIIDSAMDAIITIDETHNIVMFNRAAEEMFRCRAGEAVGTPVHRFLPVRFRAAHGRHIRNFGATGTTNRAMGALEPLCAMRTSGQEFPIEASISQMECAGRKLFTVIVRDISERRMIEDQLRDQAQILDMAQVMLREKNGRILLWTAGAEKMYGFSAEEALGRISHDLLNTRFPKSLADIEQQLDMFGRWEGELFHRKKDGTEISVAALMVVEQRVPGRESRILVAVSDTSARKQAEQKLRDSQAKFTAIIESAMDAIIAIDVDQRIVLFNPAAERMFCMAAGQALGQPLERFIPEPYRAAHGEHVKHFGRTGTTSRAMGTLGSIRGLRASGEEFPIEASISQLLVGDTKLFTVILRDISERKRTEDEIHKLNEDLERRVEERTAQLQLVNHELEAFTYSVSHDLRAPIRHIDGFAKLLVEEAAAGLSPEANRYLQRIQQGSRRMGTLVDELLDLTRVGRHALRVQATDLRALVGEVVTMLQPEYEGRKVEWKLGELPQVMCDAALVRQVFQNLISNALKYSRPRERTVIEVGRIPGQEDTLFVRDNGVGFSMKYADKLFGVFQRLHRAEEFEGTGIGLATVHRIIQKHGGKVWAESEADRGATFYFTLGGAGAAHDRSPAAAKGAMA
jgi:PAS domain S-box-containing protein